MLVMFKLATLTFKTLQVAQPIYLRELIAVIGVQLGLAVYEPVGTLRSFDQHLLCLERTTTVFANRSFKHSSTIVWKSTCSFS